MYMFCGEHFCSMTLATGNLQAQTNAVRECFDTQETSCCAEENSPEEESSQIESSEEEAQCHTELHIAQLSIDALQAASSLAFDYSAPVVAVLPIHVFIPQSPQTQAFTTSILANPPPIRNDKHILFRSLLI